MNKRYVNLIIIIISVLIAVILIGTIAIQPLEEPSGKFFRINGKSSTINIIFVSWLGCPIGASLSWPLYFALLKYGNLSYYEWHSDPNDVYPDTPGLIFKGYFSNTINATFIYLYNETLTGNQNNETINGNLVSYGLSELKSELPCNYYKIIKKYTTIDWISGSLFESSADSVSPHHINTVLLISGPNGSYFLNGALYNPGNISIYGDNYLLKYGDKIKFIRSAEENILEHISMVE
ncbi:DUF929 domain-containing protein [Picrophilus oshimae]|uniref:Hypothetical membrane associated protein n=1 Tax=Picrophilus torridus (strain ATCC 700027 / DSM 9790 / JCM 10055 / NBRC 100828 / KAW 2/3) TaxID=1122961 RepID=Q6L2S3_PICTO|nr:DUF929 domain-containing protein [Picrophilus oshimae]AAT42729.1 hypothetical membrane associated protein [Picrophilus oshimae DSM 9789]